MENDYRYFLKVGFFDDEDEELNIDFDAAIEEVTSTGSFNCEICQKKYKTVGGLKRHKMNIHSKVTDFHLDLNILEELLTQSIEIASKDLCLKVERRTCISKFVYQKVEIVQLLEEISKICKDFLENKDPEKFFSSYFSSITASAETFFPNYPSVSSTTVMMQLDEVIFAKLNKTELTERIPTPISEKEMDGLNYLAGYVIQKLMKKMKKRKDEKQAEKQAEKQVVISLLEDAIDKYCTNDHINTLSRGLITITEHSLRIFYKEKKKNFDVLLKLTTYEKIDVGSVSGKLINNPDIVSLFSVVSDGINIQNEIKDNILEKMLELYLRVR